MIPNFCANSNNSRKCRAGAIAGKCRTRYSGFCLYLHPSSESCLHCSCSRPPCPSLSWHNIRHLQESMLMPSMKWRIIYIQIFHLLLRCTIRLSTGRSRLDLNKICWPLRSGPPSDVALISKFFVCIVNKIIINNVTNEWSNYDITMKRAWDALGMYFFPLYFLILIWVLLQI